MNELKFGGSSDMLFDPCDIEGWQFLPNGGGGDGESRDATVETNGVLDSSGRRNRPVNRTHTSVASLPPPPVPPRSLLTFPVGSRVNRGGDPGIDDSSPASAVSVPCSLQNKSAERVRNMFTHSDPFQDEFFRS
ncbi:unnamed protein product [Soboliphyme baturini]|uniref:Uncharacterized protein n=1 Tax=Soboliphyme baturini TaxID=241478 RepID=A0A183IJ76_9BILA|nr:unnamed protein product [Soboliphyme baturini]